MAITATQQREFLKIGVGLYGAALGSDYLNLFARVSEAGFSISQIYAALMADPFSQQASLYPAYLTNDQFADRLVKNATGNILTGDALAQAKAIVTGQLNAGKTRAEAAQYFVDQLDSATETDASFGTAAKLFDNRVTVASYYSIDKGLSSSSLGTLQTVVSGVTNTTDVSTAAALDQVLAGSGSISGQAFTLTTGVDIKTGTAANDTFDGSVNANGTATLTSVDQLNGGEGTDTLIGGLAGGNIAAKLTSIENAEFITSAATTLDLINTTGLTNLLMRNSSATLTVNNIGATTGTTFTAQDQAADINLNFTNSALTGANAFTLALSGAQSDASGGAAIAIAQQAGGDTTGLETLTLTSGGSGTNFLDAVTVRNAAATSTLATLNVTGAQGLTVTNNFEATARTINASGMTGTTGLNAGFAATAAVTVTGSGGNDTLTFASNNANSTIDAGAGNDVITLANFDANDSVAGGDGTADRLNISAANAEAIASALTTTTGFEQLSLNTAGTAAASINATRFGTVDTIRLDVGTAGAYGVTAQAGTVTVGIGNAAAGALAGALTVTDTGTASTDVLNLTNRHTSGAVDAFGGQAITSAGYETINLSTGAVATGAQTVGNVTVNNDSLTGANTLNISGVNGVTVANFTSNSSGLFTVNASGLTGTTGLTMGAAPTFSVATGTLSVTGSANADTLLGAAASASTLVGGAGNDTITGGTAADSITGDAGNDQITGAGGNDTVSGGEGNDTIDVSGAAGTVSVDGGAGNDTVTMGATLSSSDVLNGGDGTDTLSITAAATAATAAGVTNFETLTLAAALGGQGLEQFTTNTTFTRLNYGAFANAVTNAGSNIATLSFAAGAGATSMARLVDTSSNAIALQASASGAVGITSLAINDEETVTVSTTASSAAANITFTDMTANDLTSLTVSGLGNFAVTNAIAGAANLATINASGNSGTVVINASASTANITATGAFSAANTITGGTGADTITGGTAADSLVGGNGGDSLVGGAGSDTLDGGLGADVLLGEIGADTLIGGIGNDTLTGGDAADTFRFEASQAANGIDTITDFVSGTDKLDLITTNAVVAAGGAVTATTTAGAGDSITLADNDVRYISMNGAAANLTTAGTATLSAADLTASTLTNLAAYLDERIATSATNGHDAVIVVNWTAGGSTSSYVYEFIEANASATIQAAELTLLGVVTRGTTVLTTGDVI